jgi:archaetidylinositol phosphate synthase
MGCRVDPQGIDLQGILSRQAIFARRGSATPMASPPSDAQKAADKQPVQRIQQNVLAANERRVLNWLCARMPIWLSPDKLTIIGFVGSLLIAAGYILSTFDPHWLWLSIISYFINWFGDSLDGSIARYRGIERPNFGYFIDHSLDALGTAIMLIAIGMSPYVQIEIAMLVLITYLLLSIHTFLAAKVTGEFNLTYLAAGPTELRLILIAMTLAMLWFGPSPITSHIDSLHQFGLVGYSGFDIFVGLFILILFSLFIIKTAQIGYKLRALRR